MESTQKGRGDYIGIALIEYTPEGLLLYMGHVAGSHGVLYKQVCTSLKGIILNGFGLIKGMDSSRSKTRMWKITDRIQGNGF